METIPERITIENRKAIGQQHTCGSESGRQRHHMTDPGIYKQPVQLLRADIRLEVLLAEILAEDAVLDDIVVMSNSLFTRNFHRDIEKTGEIQFEQSRKRK